MRINPKLKGELKKFVLDKIRSDHERIVVYSSVRLSKDDVGILKSKFSGISFQNAQYCIDESLLAGVMIKVGSKIIDCSVKGTLSNLKHIVYEAY